MLQAPVQLLPVVQVVLASIGREEPVTVIHVLFVVVMKHAGVPPHVVEVQMGVRRLGGRGRGTEDVRLRVRTAGVCWLRCLTIDPPARIGGTSGRRSSHSAIRKGRAQEGRTPRRAVRCR